MEGRASKTVGGGQQHPTWAAMHAAARRVHGLRQQDRGRACLEEGGSVSGAQQHCSSCTSSNFKELMGDGGLEACLNIGDCGCQLYNLHQPRQSQTRLGWPLPVPADVQCGRTAVRTSVWAVPWAHMWTAAWTVLWSTSWSAIRPAVRPVLWTALWKLRRSFSAFGSCPQPA